MTSPMTYCMHCGTERSGDQPFCAACGANTRLMELAPRQLACPACTSAVAVTWRNCLTCGAGLTEGTYVRPDPVAPSAPPPSPATPSPASPSPQPVEPPPGAPPAQEMPPPPPVSTGPARAIQAEIEEPPRVQLISQPRDIQDVIDLTATGAAQLEVEDVEAGHMDAVLHTPIAELKRGAAPADERPGYLPAGPVGQWAQLTLLAFGLVSLATIGGLLLLNIRLDAFREGTGTIADAEGVRDVLNLWLRPLAVGFGALAVGLVVAWAYRAHENIVAFGISGRRVPGWMAVVAWFIPGINLVVPYRVLNDAWRGSHPEATDRNWTSLRRNHWVDVWWVAVVAAAATGIASALAGSDTTAASMDSNTWLAVTYGLLVLVVLAAVRTIETTNQRQRSRD